MIAVMGAIVNIVITAVNLPVLGVPIFYYILVSLIVGTVTSALTRGE